MSRIQTAGALAVALISLTACGKGEEKGPVAATAPVAASVAPQAASAPASAASAFAHEYASREGDVFYYKAEDGSLVGARDLGRLPANQDFSGLLKKGDRAVQFDGRMFAAVTPGSDVVRISRNLPGEQILRPIENVPLSGGAVAAKALRDSLAGRLLFPSEAELDARLKAEPAQEAQSDAEDGVSNARPDDYK